MWRRVVIVGFSLLGVTALLLLLLACVDVGPGEPAYDTINATWLSDISHALREYRAKHGGLPPQASSDANGRALLSWRVLLLPFLGEADLYRQFRLDEPWDSEHNRTLIGKMPDYYKTTGRHYRFSGEGKTCFLAIAEPGKPLGDLGPGAGLPNRDDRTIVVEANADCATIWTKPKDLSPSGGISKLRARVSGERSGRVVAILANGKVIIAEPESLWNGNGVKGRYFQLDGE
jgi:hypothetical protein